MRRDAARLATPVGGAAGRDADRRAGRDAGRRRGGLTGGLAGRTVGVMARPNRPSTEAMCAALPGVLQDAVAGFARHLASERNRSAHTGRAYAGDLVSLLDHAVRMGVAAPPDLDLAIMRGWLARAGTAGASPATPAAP